MSQQKLTKPTKSKVKKSGGSKERFFGITSFVEHPWITAGAILLISGGLVWLAIYSRNAETIASATATAQAIILSATSFALNGQEYASS